MEKTVLVDDLDGTMGAETREFSVERFVYEIDLTDANRAKLYEALEPFIAAGRRVSGPGAARRPRKPSRPQLTPEATERVRVWARENGHRVADRGRLPQAVIDAYDKAHEQGEDEATVA